MSWALQGAVGREKHVVTSFDIDPVVLEKMNFELVEKFERIESKEKRWEEYKLDDADVVITAFGTIGRISKSVVEKAREEGIKVGLFRPITLWPFPYERLEEIVKGKRLVLDVEMNMGQMLEDVKLAVKDNARVAFYKRMGGMVPTPEEILNALKMELGR